MTLDTLAALANVISPVMAGAAILLAFFVRATATSAIDKRCTSIDAKIDAAAKSLYDRLNANHDRITRMEGMVDDMPRVADVHALSLQLAAMAGDVKGMTAKMESLEQNSKLNREAVARIENHIFKIES